MERPDGFRRRGYRVAMVFLLAATFVGLIGKIWAAVMLVGVAMVLVAAVEEINDAVMRRVDGTPTADAAAVASGA
jgi:diacylglycerol kinase